MTHSQKVALVTGGNRGIGKAICQGLAQQNRRVILTSRDRTQGEKAAAELGDNVTYHPLDVTDRESVQALVPFLEKEWGGLDILVNNAGVMIDEDHAPDGGTPSVLDAKASTLQYTLLTNTFGPLRLCQALIPLMTKKNYGRVVNISSGMGQLSEMNGGWAGYRLSKVSLNALTRMLADELKGTNVKVNAVCPGWVRTEMGGEGTTRSVEQGAETPVWLATLPDDGPSGLFFRDKKPIPW